MAAYRLLLVPSRKPTLSMLQGNKSEALPVQIVLAAFPCRSAERNNSPDGFLLFSVGF
jgi:hypothetical protein